jgi:hypothetical protein
LVLSREDFLNADSTYCVLFNSVPHAKVLFGGPHVIEVTYRQQKEKVDFIACHPRAVSEIVRGSDILAGVEVNLRRK